MATVGIVVVAVVVVEVVEVVVFRHGPPQRSPRHGGACDPGGDDSGVGVTPAATMLVGWRRPATAIVVEGGRWRSLFCAHLSSTWAGGEGWQWSARGCGAGRRGGSGALVVVRHGWVLGGVLCRGWGGCWVKGGCWGDGRVLGWVCVCWEWGGR